MTEIEQPTGYIEVPAILSSEGMEQVRYEFACMIREWNGTLPFPEYVAEYAKLHPIIWQYHPIGNKNNE